MNEKLIKTCMIMMKQKYSHIFYLDFNGQYGWTLAEPIPYDRFEYPEDIYFFVVYMWLYHKLKQKEIFLLCICSRGWISRMLTSTKQRFIIFSWKK